MQVDGASNIRKIIHITSTGKSAPGTGKGENTEEMSMRTTVVSEVSARQGIVWVATRNNSGEVTMRAIQMKNSALKGKVENFIICGIQLMAIFLMVVLL